MTTGSENQPPPPEPADGRLLELIRRSQRDIGPDQPFPSEDALLAFLEDRAGAGHLAEIREALENRPSLAAWLAELVESCEDMNTESARGRFDDASIPPLPRALLRDARAGLDRALGTGHAPVASRVRERLLAGWAALATVAAAFLLVTNIQPPRLAPSIVPTPPGPAPVSEPRRAPQASLPLDQRVIPPPSIETPRAIQPTAPTAPAYGMRFLGDASVTLRSRTRGVSAPVETVELPAPTPFLRLTVESPDEPLVDPGNGRLRVELRGPGGLVIKRSGKVSDLWGEGKIVLFSDRPFPRGRYDLEIRGLWAGADPSPEPYRFNLRYRSSHP